MFEEFPRLAGSYSPSASASRSATGVSDARACLGTLLRVRISSEWSRDREEREIGGACEWEREIDRGSERVRENECVCEREIDRDR